MTRYLSLALLLLAAVGCGGSSLTEHTFCEKRAASTCRYIYSCCNAGERLAILEGLDQSLDASEESQTVCTKQYTASCLETMAVSFASLSVGRVAFDSTAASTCLKSIDDHVGTCPETVTVAKECDLVFTGTVDPDGECAYSGECTGEAFCQDNGASPGKCVAKLDQAGLCGSDLECKDGLYCLMSGTTQYYCVAEPTALAGASCTSGMTRCAAGYYCDSSSDKCTAQKPSGQTCSSTDQCATGLVCNSYTCGAGIAQGQQCYNSGSGSGCALGLYCDATQYQCLAAKAIGATCTSTAECQDTAYCDPTSSHCAARPSVGQQCGTMGGSACQTGLACLPRGSCTPQGTVGSLCASTTACQDTLICDPTSAKCATEPTKAPEGDFCNDATDCQSGHCDSGLCVAYCVGK
jgi:hypothetical protein